jgi:hypothetical protein
MMHALIALLVAILGAGLFVAKTILDKEYWFIARAVGTVLARCAGLLLPRQTRTERVDEWLGELDFYVERRQAAVSYALGLFKAALGIRRAQCPMFASIDTGGTVREGRPRSRHLAHWLGRTAIALAVGAASVVVAGIWPATDAVAVSGSAICTSGRPVVGVWIAAITAGDSGFAHFYPAAVGPHGAATEANARYTYELPHAGPYSVHVGCGGTARLWASSISTRTLVVPSALLFCHDLVPAVRSVVHGVCTAARRA